MLLFEPITNLNQINLSRDWVDVSASATNGQVVEKDGRSYRLIVKERLYSYEEKLARRVLGVFLVIFSFGIALNLPSVQSLFTEKKAILCFGLLQKTPETDFRAGISSYQSSSCYLSASLQALAGLKNRHLLTQGDDEVSQFLKKVFSALDHGCNIPAHVTKKWTEEALSLGLTTQEPGVYGDPADVVHAILHQKFYDLSVRTISAGSSIQDVIDGKTAAKKPICAKDSASAPSFFALGLQGRCLNTGYDAKSIITPHRVMMRSEDGIHIPYSLHAAIVFLGTTVNGGENHYYTYERVDATTWREYNNSTVREIVDVDGGIQEMIEQRGYVLFYSKE